MIMIRNNNNHITAIKNYEKSFFGNSTVKSETKNNKDSEHRHTKEN